MEEREENPHKRLNQQFSELEKEWAAMRTGKGSSAISCITMEEALEFVEHSPRELMLSLQHDQACPKAEMIQMRSPCRRKLFHDFDDDETKTTTFSHSTCWSSNVMRVRDNNNNNNNKKKRRRIVSVSMIVILLLVLVVVMDGFDHHSMSKQIDTLVPT